MFIYSICTQYLIGSHFALIMSQFGVAWRVISCDTANPRFLWQWPSAHLYFLLSCFSHFPSWQYPLDSLWGSGLVSLPASQAHQHHGLFNQLLVLLAVCGRCQILWENEISIFKSLVNQKEAWSAPKCIGKTGAVTLVFKNTRTNTSRWHCTPKSSQDCGNLTLDFKQLGLWASPTHSSRL